MKTRTLSILGLLLTVSVLAFPTIASAQEAREVKIEGATFQEVLDRLFGTTTTTGLLSGTNRFDLHAEEITLTPEQAALFFNPTTVNASDFADLISAVEKNKGELKIEGNVLGGDSFQFQLSGKQVKAEGLVLTQAQFDALVAELKGISGLKEAKIEATVDGRLLEAKLENQAGRVKIEGLEHDRRGPERAGDHRGPARPAKVEVERGERVERAERVEKVERVERTERIEHPELEHGGAGRH